MKRRNFLKGLLGLVALPVAAKAGIKPDKPMEAFEIGQRLTEQQKAMRDMMSFGNGVMKDGKHIPLEDIYLNYDKTPEQAMEMFGEPMTATERVVVNEPIYWNGRYVTYEGSAVHFPEVMDYAAWEPDKKLPLAASILNTPSRKWLTL